MVSLKPGEQHYSTATIRLLLAAAFIVAVHGDCGVPPHFSFAELKEEYRRNKAFAVGDKVEYVCRPGYTRVFKSTLECTKYSLWSENRVFCKARSCPHPGEPENGRLVILTDLTFGATVNFNCEEGYRLIGNAERKCVLEGSQVRWDKEIPYCQLIPCGPPPEIEHGTHTGTLMEEFNYGTSVTYRCNGAAKEGVPFSLIGEASIHCTSKDNVNGEWSAPAPQCKAIRCPQPKVDKGKQMTGYSPIYTYRASVMFECVSPYYTLKGSSILECDENNSWAPQLPVCERSSCDEPPYIHNTDHNSSNSRLFPAGTVVKYDCIRGYELIPGMSSLITCQKDFTWSGRREFCQKIRCQHPDVKNGRVERGSKEIYVYEDKVTIVCNSGYTLKSGTGQSKCKYNREWEPALPVCEPGILKKILSFLFGNDVDTEKACQSPPLINGGRHDAENGQFLPIGSVVKYSCYGGWLLVGERSIKCIAGDEETARWQGDAPQCQEIVCPRPHIENGRHETAREKYRFRESITLKCNRGYNLEGHNTSTCTENGSWQPPLPACSLKIRCPKPVIENGKQIPASGMEYTYGSTVEFQCDSGYTLEGNKSINCDTNAKWNPPVPSCVKAGCPKPDLQNGGMVNGSDKKVWYNMNENITFMCSPGYQFSDAWYLSEKDNLTITCSADGTWTMLPKCEKQSNAPVCKMVRKSKEFLRCGVPLEELKTLLEIQKLFLEIQKLKKDLKKYNG
uniref:Complement component 4 binding protein alpha n=1 Tax=Pelusios castaneus TaxID=367368 RepID=A0A8C8S7G1_9SAUR